MQPLTPGRIPKEPNAPQIWRMQRLIEWLRDGKKLTTRLAADVFEVSRRTIASDLDHLRALGVPLTYDRHRETYVLTEPFGNLPLLTLRRTELAAFLVAQHALEAGDEPHARLLEGVAAKLAEHLPETIRVTPEVLTRTIRFEAGPHPPVPLVRLGVLEEAVRRQQVVRIRYASSSTGQE